MAYSVLTIKTQDHSHGLYCSKQQKIIMGGTSAELFDIKHILEEMEQQQDNEKHLKALKKKYLKIMVSGGNSMKASEELLMKQLPFLYQKTTA
jgi:hypothetical protein